MKYIETTIEVVKVEKVNLQLPNTTHAKEIVEFLGESQGWQPIFDKKEAVLVTLHLFMVRDVMFTSEYFTLETYEQSMLLFNEVKSKMDLLGWSKVFNKYYDLALASLQAHDINYVSWLIGWASRESVKLCDLDYFL